MLNTIASHRPARQKAFENHTAVGREDQDQHRETAAWLMNIKACATNPAVRHSTATDNDEHHHTLAIGPDQAEACTPAPSTIPSATPTIICWARHCAQHVGRRHAHHSRNRREERLRMVETRHG